jgi:hypothetical protein
VGVTAKHRVDHLAHIDPAKEDPMPQGLPDILYIMGTGRSGTTILEILLANNPGFAGVGEVKHIFRDGFISDHVCSCGQTTHQCELWSSVLRSTGWTLQDCARLGNTVQELESHKRFPLIWADVGSKQAKEDYSNAARDLFRSVAAARECRVVVDSSKFAGRALLLARALPERIKVLCITRSADGLLKAFAKKNENEQKPKSALAASAYYLYVLLCMRLVKARLKDRCFAIRFEDLNRDPDAVLAKIENWSGYSFSTTRARIGAQQAFDVGHIVTGNRLRKKGKVKFEPGSAKFGGKADSAIAKVLAPVLETYRRLLGF